jgi:tetratricopeptide (TPR) repeat protein
LHQNLTQAYASFQRGENTHALTAYQTVLQQEPRNRDALLGVAAIAVRQGNHPQARRYYQEVLKYYPQDPVAQTNLLSISEQVNHEERETQLKTLTRTTQQPAYVYFQLGLVYAQQNRWNDAQQAFFEAYRIDSQQADYAYNLAVSLEYLHQPQAAVTYYQRAMQLQQKQGKSRSFEPHLVQQRIATLLKMPTRRREVTNLLDNVE